MTSTIFASEDIAELVRIFDPSISSSTPKQPPLIRADNHLIVSSEISSNIQAILQDSDNNVPISRAELSRRVGVDTTTLNTVLEQIEIPISFGANGDLLPICLADHIVSDLDKMSQHQIVDLEEFARKHNINLSSLRRLCQDKITTWQTWPKSKKSPHGELFCSLAYRRRLQHSIADAIAFAEYTGTRTNITSRVEFEDIPRHVIRDLTLNESGSPRQEILKDGILKGEFVEKDSHISYVPSGFAQAEKERREAEVDLRAEEVLAAVERDGHVLVNCESEQAFSVIVAVQSKVPSIVSVRTIHAETNPPRKGSPIKRFQILKAETLEKHLANLIATAVARLSDLWIAGTRDIDLHKFVGTLYPDKAEESTTLLYHDLTKSRDYAPHIENAVRSRLADLEREDADRMIVLIEDKLILPVRLFSDGLSAINDPALKERLDEYEYKHLLPEIQNLDTMLQQKHLLHGPRAKEYSKFQTASKSATSITALHSATSKFAKKLKLDPPGTSRLREKKRDIMNGFFNGVKPHVRGSDVLQHALWILLAEKCNGVFVSAGKDTSRMISQFEAVGDPETTQKLKSLRDLLKAGQAAREETQEVRELAMRAVEHFVARDL